MLVLVLMHKDDLVAAEDENGLNIVLPNKLPFPLRSKCDYASFKEWVYNRLFVLNRKYALDVYALRRLERDMEKALKDSDALSAVDGFWITDQYNCETWDEKRKSLDSNKHVAVTALTGEIEEGVSLVGAKEFSTTYLTLKGMYPKIIANSELVKRGYTCEYEVLGYMLGKQLGINTAEALSFGSCVTCKLFTNDQLSLAHAREFEDLTDYKDDAEGETTDMHRALYEYFLTQQRFDLCKQLERVYLLKYIAGDSDFHSENFGVLYDSDNFTLHSIAPAYDFNKAFKPDFRPHSMYPWMYSKLQDFIRNNDDVYVKLRDTSDVFVAGLPYLDHLQKAELKGRITYLLSLM